MSSSDIDDLINDQGKDSSYSTDFSEDNENFDIESQLSSSISKLSSISQLKTMDVSSLPEITVFPTQVKFPTTFPNVPNQQRVIIANSGVTSEKFDVSCIGDPEFSISTHSISLRPGETSAFYVSFRSKSVSLFKSSINIEGRTTFSIPVTANSIPSPLIYPSIQSKVWSFQKNETSHIIQLENKSLSISLSIVLALNSPHFSISPHAFDIPPGSSQSFNLSYILKSNSPSTFKSYLTLQCRQSGDNVKIPLSIIEAKPLYVVKFNSVSIGYKMNQRLNFPSPINISPLPTISWPFSLDHQEITQKSDRSRSKANKQDQTSFLDFVFAPTQVGTFKSKVVLQECEIELSGKGVQQPYRLIIPVEFPNAPLKLQNTSLTPVHFRAKITPEVLLLKNPDQDYFKLDANETIIISFEPLSSEIEQLTTSFSLFWKNETVEDEVCDNYTLPLLYFKNNQYIQYADSQNLTESSIISNSENQKRKKEKSPNKEIRATKGTKNNIENIDNKDSNNSALYHNINSSMKKGNKLGNNDELSDDQYKMTEAFDNNQFIEEESFREEEEIITHKSLTSVNNYHEEQNNHIHPNNKYLIGKHQIQKPNNNLINSPNKTTLNKVNNQGSSQMDHDQNDDNHIEDKYNRNYTNNHNNSTNSTNSNNDNDEEKDDNNNYRTIKSKKLKSDEKKNQDNQNEMNLIKSQISKISCSRSFLFFGGINDGNSYDDAMLINYSSNFSSLQIRCPSFIKNSHLLPNQPITFTISDISNLILNKNNCFLDKIVLKGKMNSLLSIPVFGYLGTSNIIIPSSISLEFLGKDETTGLFSFDGTIVIKNSGTRRGFAFLSVDSDIPYDISVNPPAVILAPNKSEEIRIHIYSSISSINCPINVIYGDEIIRQLKLISSRNAGLQRVFENISSKSEISYFSKVFDLIDRHELSKKVGQRMRQFQVILKAEEVSTDNSSKVTVSPMFLEFISKEIQKLTLINITSEKIHFLTKPKSSHIVIMPLAGFIQPYDQITFNVSLLQPIKSEIVIQCGSEQIHIPVISQGNLMIQDQLTEIKAQKTRHSNSKGNRKPNSDNERKKKPTMSPSATSNNYNNHNNNDNSDNTEFINENKPRVNHHPSVTFITDSIPENAQDETIQTMEEDPSKNGNFSVDIGEIDFGSCYSNQECTQIINIKNEEDFPLLMKVLVKKSINSKYFQIRAPNTTFLSQNYSIIIPSQDIIPLQLIFNSNSNQSSSNSKEIKGTLIVENDDNIIEVKLRGTKNDNSNTDNISTCESITFPETEPMIMKRAQIKIVNKSEHETSIKVEIKGPFICPNPEFVISARSYVLCPIHFHPREEGDYEGYAKFISQRNCLSVVHLYGSCIDEQSW